MSFIFVNLLSKVAASLWNACARPGLQIDNDAIDWELLPSRAHGSAFYDRTAGLSTRRSVSITPIIYATVVTSGYRSKSTLLGASPVITCHIWSMGSIDTIDTWPDAPFLDGQTLAALAEPIASDHGSVLSFQMNDTGRLLENSVISFTDYSISESSTVYRVDATGRIADNYIAAYGPGMNLWNTEMYTAYVRLMTLPPGIKNVYGDDTFEIELHEAVEPLQMSEAISLNEWYSAVAILDNLKEAPPFDEVTDLEEYEHRRKRAETALRSGVGTTDRTETAIQHMAQRLAKAQKPREPLVHMTRTIGKSVSMFRREKTPATLPEVASVAAPRADLAQQVCLYCFAVRSYKEYSRTNPGGPRATDERKQPWVSCVECDYACYCSELCSQSDNPIHRHECRLLRNLGHREKGAARFYEVLHKHFSPFDWNEEDKDIRRGLLLNDARFAIRMWAADKAANTKDVTSKVLHTGIDSIDPTLQGYHAWLAALIYDCWREERTTFFRAVYESFFKASMRAQVNSFSVSADPPNLFDSMGRTICYYQSMIDHTCGANAVSVAWKFSPHRPPTQNFIVQVSKKTAGETPTEIEAIGLNYGKNKAKIAERRHYLLFFYGFHCQCMRCSKTDAAREASKKLEDGFIAVQ